jgi:leader peptidase (prepilin peptidase) / N-methyltransferase
VSPELLALRPYWIVFAGILGAMLGSFLNVCILRWGAEPKLSVVRPRSRCPRCGKSLAWYENVPVVSWLVLRGRCSGCGLPISVQYPLIELATAGIWAYVVWQQGPTLEALRQGAFGTILLGIAMTDAREFIIPHEFSLGGTVIALLLSAWPDPSNAMIALQGALVGAGSVLLIGELSELAVGQEAMGGGDCALMGMIGAFLGWQAILPVLLVGAVISTIIYLVMAIGRRGRAIGAFATETPPQRPQPETLSSAVSTEPEPGRFRWGMVLKLFLAGVVPILLLVAAVELHLIAGVLTALFHGLLAAGFAYYASFLLPASVEGSWIRVRGLLAASVGIAVGGGLILPRLAVGLVVAVVLLWYARRSSVVLSPETTEQLEMEGYLPFGVGLAIAAGVVLISGAMPLVREVWDQYGRILRWA